MHDMQEETQTMTTTAATKAELELHETQDAWTDASKLRQPAGRSAKRDSHQQTMSLTSALGLMLLVLVTLVFAVGPCLFMRAPGR